eukprot:scaffold105504_cov20-Prasinocladus_malaysianus.AAC.2
MEAHYYVHQCVNACIPVVAQIITAKYMRLRRLVGCTNKISATKSQYTTLQQFYDKSSRSIASQSMVDPGRLLSCYFSRTIAITEFLLHTSAR